jgi:hypothetical protein
MREWHVRMTVRTNTGDGRSGQVEYHTDDEIPRVLHALLKGALEDVDDGPEIIWAEWTRQYTFGEPAVTETDR